MSARYAYLSDLSKAAINRISQLAARLNASNVLNYIYNIYL